MTGLPRRDALPSSATPCLVRVRRPGSVPSFPPPRSWGPLERWLASGRATSESTPLANPPHLGFNPGQAREPGRLPHAAQSACFPQPALAPGAHGRPHRTRPELPSPGHDGRRPHHQSTGNQAKPQVRSPFGRAAPIWFASQVRGTNVQHRPVKYGHCLSRNAHVQPRCRHF